MNLTILYYVALLLQWHALERSEQAKYYEMARKEKELHMQLYPGWSARDNYATHTKKKKLKREHPHHENGSADFENQDGKVSLVDQEQGKDDMEEISVGRDVFFKKPRSENNQFLCRGVVRG